MVDARDEAQVFDCLPPADRRSDGSSQPEPWESSPITSGGKPHFLGQSAPKSRVRLQFVGEPHHGTRAI